MPKTLLLISAYLSSSSNETKSKRIHATYYFPGLQNLKNGGMSLSAAQTPKLRGILDIFLLIDSASHPLANSVSFVLRVYHTSGDLSPPPLLAHESLLNYVNHLQNVPFPAQKPES